MSRRIRDYLWPCWVDKGQPECHGQACPSQLITPIWAQGQRPFCAVKVLGQVVTFTWSHSHSPWPSHHREVAEPAECSLTPAGACTEGPYMGERMCTPGHQDAPPAVLTGGGSMDVLMPSPWTFLGSCAHTASILSPPTMPGWVAGTQEPAPSQPVPFPGGAVQQTCTWHLHCEGGWP